CALLSVHASLHAARPSWFFEQVYRHAEEVLAKTPEMLPTLKQAVVVDAGGKGLLFFFQGVLAALKGEAIPVKKAAPAEKKPLFDIGRATSELQSRGTLVC